MAAKSDTPKYKSPLTWRSLLTLTVLSAYFHVFMEWVFFVTKPSSLSLLTLYEKIKVLAVSGGIYALVLLGSFAIISIPARKWKALTCIPSALMFSITALILMDNFTYTLFKFGIITTLGAWRIIYMVIFILIFRWMFRFIQRATRTLNKSASFLALGLLAVSLTGILATRISSNSNNESIASVTSSVKRPNIIVIGGDGLSANYLSAYGYRHETTPFLNQLAETSLVAENAFTNASSTTASTASVLTGREPATVKVYRYPDILSGAASFEHLPGILKRQGYKTVEIGAPHYVDARQLNLLDGFDIVNNQSMNSPAHEALVKVLGNSPSVFFIQTITERVTGRLFHIFFIREMESPFEAVTDPKSRMTDVERVDQIIGLLDQSDQPLFVFAHFMDTHGPAFSSAKHNLNTEITGDEEWDQSLYEDAIRNFDGSVKKIYDHLSKTGQLDNSVIVIYTDHGYKYTVNHRIPVIIHFPDDANAGRRKNNLQIIDIPVTLLDYLGIPRPEWMTGESFLTDELQPIREIISITAGSPKKIAPPFYQIKIVQLTVCHKWYALNVQENSWKTGAFSGHTARCDEKLLPSDEEARQKILDYLEKYGYDIDTLLNEKQDELPSTFDNPPHEFGSL